MKSDFVPLEHKMLIREMTRQECIALLSVSHLARLACAKDGQSYVVPIYFAYAENHLYSFSLPGQKVDWMRNNPLVCVEVDKFADRREWRSVVVYGIYEELTDTPQFKRQRTHAWSLLSQYVNWWEPGGLKPTVPPLASESPHLFYRIRIDKITGRQALEDVEDSVP